MSEWVAECDWKKSGGERPLEAVCAHDYLASGVGSSSPDTAHVKYLFVYTHA